MAILFEATTPLGCTIRTTEEYWQYLVEKKHPYMINRQAIVINTLREPHEIRKSNIDPSVYLYYRYDDRLYCVIAKHQAGKEGFLITAYPADKAKEGDIIWRK